MKEFGLIQLSIADIFYVVKGCSHEVRRNGEGKFAVFVSSPGWFRCSLDKGLSFEPNEAGEYQRVVFEDDKNALDYLRMFDYVEKEEDVWVQPEPSEEDREKQSRELLRMFQDPDAGKGSEHFPLGY